MSDRVIVVEVEQGIVTDVHGLPEGWTYDVVDWDVFDVCETDLDGLTLDDYQAIIDKAAAQE